MNYELWRLYENLSASLKAQLGTSFADAPKTLRLIEFLEQAAGDFKTLRAVKYIYKEELEDTNYEVLVNRFYKLRQSFKEWIVEQTEPQGLLTELEKQLVFLREMVTRNEFAFSLPQLQQLSKQCREDNLFEFMPEILMLILRCVQNLEYEAAEKQRMHEAELLEAQDLLLAWQRAQVYNRKSLRIDEAVAMTQELKRLAQKYRQYPRFTMLYHLTAFTRGVFMPTQVQRSANALSRHLNELQQLRQDYPQIPVLFYEPHHQERLDFDVLLHGSVFHFYRGKLAEAMQAVDEREALRYRYPGLIPRRSESEFNNMTIIYLLNKAYDKVWDTIDEFFEFNELQGRPQQRYLPYIMLFHCYCFCEAEPRPIENEASVLAKSEGFIQQAFKEGNEHLLTFLMPARIDYLLHTGQLRAADLKMLSNYPPSLDNYSHNYSIPKELVLPWLKASIAKDKAKLRAILNQIGPVPKGVDVLVQAHSQWLRRVLARDSN